MTRNIISLTTIPPRMGLIAPTLESLLAQSAEIDEVQLWVPERYRRSGFDGFEIPAFPEGVRVMRCPTDLGPATKVLPAALSLAGEDVRILYCDDDRIYHPDWAARLIEENRKHPEECITETGEPLRATEMRAERETFGYKLRNVLTLSVYAHRHRRRMRRLIREAVYVDIAKGYGGAVVRPHFFGPEAAEIPEPFWPVDDIWLSGQLALNGIRIRNAGKTELTAERDLRKVHALVDFENEGLGRNAANMACIDYYRRTHGIWLSETSPTPRHSPAPASVPDRPVSE